MRITKVTVNDANVGVVRRGFSGLVTRLEKNGSRYRFVWVRSDESVKRSQPVKAGEEYAVGPDRAVHQPQLSEDTFWPRKWARTYRPGTGWAKIFKLYDGMLQHPICLDRETFWVSAAAINSSWSEFQEAVIAAQDREHQSWVERKILSERRDGNTVSRSVLRDGLIISEYWHVDAKGDPIIGSLGETRYGEVQPAPVQ
jgi:hypothetical protein